MNKKICSIVGAGINKGNLSLIKNSDFIIAADGGYKYLSDGTVPDIFVGDFDSLDIIPQAKKIVKLIPQKDVTDTFECITQGIEAGCEIFNIYCGTGGEFDHTFANIQCLIYLAKKGMKGYLFDGDKVITAIYNSSIAFSNEASGKISVFAADSICVGVNIKRLKYELSSGQLNNDFALGVRNCFVGKGGIISVKEGCLLLVFNKEALQNVI